MEPLILPALAAFYLDFVLWPFSADTDVSYPCAISKGLVRDQSGRGKIIQYYPEVPVIFDRLNSSGVKIGVYYPTEDENVPQLLELFDMNKYLTYKEIDATHSIDLIERMQNKSKIPFKKMLLFNYIPLHPKDVKRMGHVVDVESSGINARLVEQELKEFDRKQREDEDDI